MARSSKFLSSQEAKDLDRKAKELWCISTLVLMENAGRHIAEEAIKIMRGRKKVVIFCGKGNNGGDGFVASRHLLTQGIKPDIFLVGRISEIENEARVNLDILIKLKQKIREVEEKNLYLIKEKVHKCDLIIDALLGVGLKGKIRGIYRDLIGVINTSRKYVLSIDIPSGLDANAGKILGCCVKADKTVTFVAKKRGMLLGEGPEYCGRVVVKDLGIPY